MTRSHRIFTGHRLVASIAAGVAVIVVAVVVIAIAASGSGSSPAKAGSNARSGPAAGGVVGTVGSVSTSSFTVSTSAGQRETVKKASSTTYRNGTSSTSASAIKKGVGVLVLGTANGTTITAAQVVLHPASGATTTFSPS